MKFSPKIHKPNLCFRPIVSQSQAFQKPLVKNLMKVDVPEEFLLGKPTLPELSQETELADLIGDQSWSLLSLLEIGKEEEKTWMEADVSKNLSYQKFAQFVKNMETVNENSSTNSGLCNSFKVQRSKAK